MKNSLGLIEDATDSGLKPLRNIQKHGEEEEQHQHPGEEGDEVPDDLAPGELAGSAALRVRSRLAGLSVGFSTVVDISAPPR